MPLENLFPKWWKSKGSQRNWPKILRMTINSTRAKFRNFKEERDKKEFSPLRSGPLVPFQLTILNPNYTTQKMVISTFKNPTRRWTPYEIMQRLKG